MVPIVYQVREVWLGILLCRIQSNDCAYRCFREANDLWDDREDWAQSTLIEVSKESSQETLVESKRVSSVDSLYSCTKEDIENRVIQLDAQISQDEDVISSAKTADALRSAKDRFAQWRSSRRSGTGRKMATGFQGFLVTFSDFLESFSGIVEIVKAADQHYGGLAYGTLSVFLSVAVHKDQREEAIEDALEELAYAFPRLEVLQSLQPSERLQELIADVFGLVIKFARETAAYFASRVQRLREAMSPEKQKMKTMSRIRKQLHQIKAESDTLLLQDISDMRQKIEEMSSVVQATQTIAKDMSVRVRSTESVTLAHRNSADVQYLAGIRASLGVQVGASSINLAKYKALLGRAFNTRHATIRKPCETTLGSLAEEPTFTEWLQRDDSRLLLAGGQNWHKHNTRDLNWLSEGSVLLTEHLISQHDEHHKVAWFLCQTDWTMTSRQKHTMQDMISSLTFQIVEMHPDKLRSYEDEIQRVARSAEWKSEDEEQSLQAFTTLLLGMLQHFDPEFTLSIVIDRLDQCRWNDPDEEAGWNMRHAIEGFLEVVENAKCRVKILLVVDAASTRPLVKYAARKKLVLKPEWQQKIPERLYR